MSWYESLISGLVAIPGQGIDLVETSQSLSKRDSGLRMDQKKKKIAYQMTSLVAKGAGLACAGGAAVLAKRGYSKGSAGTVLAAGALLVVAYDAFQIGTGMDEKDTRKGRFTTLTRTIESDLTHKEKEAKLVCRDTLVAKRFVGPIFKELKKTQ